MIVGSTPEPDGGWRDAPLLRAWLAHAGHPGQMLACGDCANRVSEALAATMELLGTTDRRPGSKLFR